jgi:hypothetical protein
MRTLLICSNSQTFFEGGRSAYYLRAYYSTVAAQMRSSIGIEVVNRRIREAKVHEATGSKAPSNGSSHRLRSHRLATANLTIGLEGWLFTIATKNDDHLRSYGPYPYGPYAPMARRYSAPGELGGRFVGDVGVLGRGCRFALPPRSGVAVAGADCPLDVNRWLVFRGDRYSWIMGGAPDVGGSGFR